MGYKTQSDSCKQENNTAVYTYKPTRLFLPWQKKKKKKSISLKHQKSLMQWELQLDAKEVYQINV